MNEDKKLLLNIIEDKYRSFQKNYSIVTTDFLDMTQASHAASFVRSHQREGVFFYGGYEDATRKMIVFIPDYLAVETEEEMFEHFKTYPEDCPLAVLDVKIREKGAVLKHSDYLGSLLGLGIKREKTGDIMVHNDGAQIFVTKEMAEYLAENYCKAGRVSVEAKVKEIKDIVIAEANIKEIRVSVASARLDNMISAAFDVSRKTAVEAIGRGLVFVDDMENKKPDYSLKGGEKLVLRGKGKAIYKGTSGTSKKGKLYVNFDRYI
ncbi:MAG: YlmH/Sll1252 family protein [Firmicutes bacterium]|nr:YlmH/Sll1252 family protein [Bacillota bacterium]